MFTDDHMSDLMSLTFWSCQDFYDSGGMKIPFWFNCKLSWRSAPFLSGPDWGERPFILRRHQGIAPDERLRRFSGERPVETRHCHRKTNAQCLKGTEPLLRTHLAELSWAELLTDAPCIKCIYMGHFSVHLNELFQIQEMRSDCSYLSCVLTVN